MTKAIFMGVKGVTEDLYSTNREAMLKSFDFETTHVIAQSELDEYSDILSRAEYIFSTWGMPALKEEEIKKYLPSLKAVFYGAGTVQKFARPFHACGVKVFSAWGANAVPVAEYTISAITMATKGFFHRFHRQSAGSSWTHRDVPVSFKGNYEITVGVIGAGMIGRIVIDKLKSLDLVTTLVFDPFLPDEKAEELGVKKVSLETLFSESDVITNHLADNKDTKGMLNINHFSLMKKGSVFINTGRGAQVVEDDLISALKEPETYRVAVLDVTEPEPPMENSPLYTLDNVFLTPHIAGSTGNELHRMAKYMFDEALLLDSGEKTHYEVTPKMLETMA